MKNFSRLVIISIFFLAGFFLFANKIQANCSDGILGTCQYDNTSCGYSYVSGHCSGPTNYRCCAPNCGQAGGNSCGVTKSGYTCTNIGRTYDCNPCYRCTQNAPAPTKPPAPTSPPSGTTCGSWCASQVGHADSPWCKCNSSTPSSGYILKGCTSGTSDCTTCCAFTQGSSGPTPTNPPSCYTSGTSCQSQGGTCGNPTSCTGTVRTGLCPGGSDCVCCIPVAGCYTSGTSCANQGGTCGNYTSSNCSGTIKTGLCPAGSNCVCCVGGGGGGGATPTPGGNNSNKTCGQICGENGSPDGASGCYCAQGSGGCPSPLVSYGASSDCTTCCTWSPSVPACGGGGGGGGGGGPTPTTPPSCNCSWVNGTCGPEAACSPGYRRQTLSCSPSGCSSGSRCTADSSCGSTCTVTLNPTSLTLVLNGQAQILSTLISEPTNGGSVNKVDFNIANTSIAEASPLSQTTFPYNTNVRGKKLGTTTATALVTLSPSGSCTSPSIPITVRVGAWFQSQGGDIHAQGNLSDNIPSTATDRNLSLDLNDYPGVVSYDPNGQVNLGEGFTSNDKADNWLASSKYRGRPYSTFDFFKKKYALQMTSNNFSGTLPNQDGIYYTSSGITLSGDWTLGTNRWLVILVDGDVNIPINITVPVGGFLAIAASGKISFASSVTTAQGMFVANTIETGSSATSFAGEGIFAATTFSLDRDFGDERNKTTPTETFVARPDFLMSSYKSVNENLWWFFQKWQELAP